MGLEYGLLSELVEKNSLVLPSVPLSTLPTLNHNLLVGPEDFSVLETLLVTSGRNMCYGNTQSLYLLIRP